MHGGVGEDFSVHGGGHQVVHQCGHRLGVVVLTDGSVLHTIGQLSGQQCHERRQGLSQFLGAGFGQAQVLPRHGQPIAIPGSIGNIAIHAFPGHQRDDDPPEAFDGVTQRFDFGCVELGGLAHHLLEHGEHEIILARKTLVESGAGQAGFLEYGTYGQAVEAFLQQNVAGRFHQFTAAPENLVVPGPQGAIHRAQLPAGRFAGAGCGIGSRLRHGYVSFRTQF